MQPQLTREQASALRDAHVAFLRRRLVDDAAKVELRAGLVAGFAHLRAQRIDALPVAAALPKTVDALLALARPEAVRTLWAPLGRELHRRARVEVRADATKVGTWVPAEGRAAIDALLARDLVPASVIETVFDQEGVEEVLRDVLYDALVEFDATVNPFFAEWGLPALIKKVMLVGSGTVLKSMGALREEFDRRLEPEMRKFLLVFARKAKKKVGAFLVAHAGDPSMVALRRNVAAFVYEQTPATLFANVDDAAAADVDRAAEAIASAVATSPEARARLTRILEALLAEHGASTVDEVLRGLGVTGEPDFDALVELVWPAVVFVAASPPAQAWLTALADEFYEGLVG